MKNNSQFITCAVAAGIAFGFAAWLTQGQDPVKVAPEFYKVLQENSQVRVLDIHLQPGQKSSMHSHPDYVVYCLTDSKVRFTTPDGKTTEAELKPGQTLFRPAETHSAENIGKTECHVLNIELRQPSRTLTQHISFAPNNLEWKAGPPSLPPGAQMTVLSGNPEKSGPFVMRFKVPAGYKIPPHWHPADEQVTVLSGSLYLGMGDKFDESKAETHGPGSYTAMPAGMHHFAFTRDETVIQLHGIGPWGINYLNPADDPRHLTPTSRTQK